MTGFVVIYDANVLYPSTLRDLLIRIAMSGLVQAKWTDQILEEVFGALRRDRPDLDEAKLYRTKELIGTAVRDWRVTNYEPLIDALQLPDPNDRHVLAAAIRAGAQVIVTSNLKHFPAKDLSGFDIDPKSPDDFVREQIDLNRDAVYTAVQQPQTRGRTHPERLTTFWIVWSDPGSPSRSRHSAGALPDQARSQSGRGSRRCVAGQRRPRRGWHERRHGEGRQQSAQPRWRSWRSRRQRPARWTHTSGAGRKGDGPEVRLRRPYRRHVCGLLSQYFAGHSRSRRRKTAARKPR